MKYLIAILFSIPFMAFSQQLCEEPYQGWNCQPIEYFNDETIEIPEYPGCEIPVSYSVKVCTNGNDTKVFVNVTGYSIPSDCQQFKDDNELPNGDPDWDFMDWFLYRAYEQISYDHFIEFYNDLTPSMKTYYECPSTYSMTYSFVMTHCTSIQVLIDYGPAGPYWKIETLKCTGDICCERTIAYCYNSSTEEVETTANSMTYLNGDCGEPDQPDPNAMWISPCIEQCFIPQKP